jgi:hypothetical protein
MDGDFWLVVPISDEGIIEARKRAPVVYEGEEGLAVILPYKKGPMNGLEPFDDWHLGPSFDITIKDRNEASEEWLACSGIEHLIYWMGNL